MMITEPKVTLWAYTTLATPGFDDDGGLLDVMPALDDVEEIHAADYLAEGAGRACYQSWDRPNPATATTEGYIDHILDVKHYSVLSHAAATFYIEGVSRSLTHELVRHRFPSFSQLSQRYVDGKDMDWVVPPLMLNDPELQKYTDHHFKVSVREYESLTKFLRERAVTEGFTGTLAKKRAREAARAVLPNCTETKIVMSANMRAWRDFLAQRWTEGADLEIQRLAGVIGNKLAEIAPATFADFDFSKPAS